MNEQYCPSCGKPYAWTTFEKTPGGYTRVYHHEHEKCNGITIFMPSPDRCIVDHEVDDGVVELIKTCGFDVERESLFPIDIRFPTTGIDVIHVSIRNLFLESTIERVKNAGKNVVVVVSGNPATRAIEYSVYSPPLVFMKKYTATIGRLASMNVTTIPVSTDAEMIGCITSAHAWRQSRIVQ